MNNKGFTLVELVAIIALLAIISIISFVSINEVLEKSKVSNCESLVRSIKSASKEYVSDNRYYVMENQMMGKDIKTISGRTQKYIEINAGDLVSGKYLSSPITDPFDNNSEIEPNDIEIIVYLLDDYSVGYKPLNNSDKTEDIIIKNKSGNEIDCSSNQW